MSFGYAFEFMSPKIQEAIIRQRDEASIQNVDIPIMAAYLLTVSLIFVTINLVVDILYTVVDPRLRSTVSRAH